MTIEAVIFDMDGILIDSEPYWFQSGAELATEIGKTWTKADHQSTMGLATEAWAQIMIEHMGLTLSIEHLIADMKRRMIAHYDEHLPILPGALEAVYSAANSYKVALASGSPRELIEHVMNLTGLDQVFHTIVRGDMVTRGKPAPDIYLEAARRLGVPPSVCIGIEDSPNGIRALKAADMIAIAIPSPNYPLADDIRDMADFVLPSLESFSLQYVSTLR